MVVNLNVTWWKPQFELFNQYYFTIKRNKQRFITEPGRNTAHNVTLANGLANLAYMW